MNAYLTYPKLFRNNLDIPSFVHSDICHSSVCAGTNLILPFKKISTVKRNIKYQSTKNHGLTNRQSVI